METLAELAAYLDSAPRPSRRQRAEWARESARHARRHEEWLAMHGGVDPVQAYLDSITESP